MATIAEIAELRLAIKEAVNTPPYTDDFLAGMIDTYGQDAAAGRIWRVKAAAVNGLVDISEGGSTRKMSQLFDQYTKTAISFENSGVVEETGYVAPRSRKATRV